MFQLTLSKRQMRNFLKLDTFLNLANICENLPQDPHNCFSKVSKILAQFG